MNDIGKLAYEAYLNNLRRREWNDDTWPDDSRTRGWDDLSMEEQMFWREFAEELVASL